MSPPLQRPGQNLAGDTIVFSDKYLHTRP
jgi:hypothetical protein